MGALSTFGAPWSSGPTSQSLPFAAVISRVLPSVAPTAMAFLDQVRALRSTLRDRSPERICCIDP